MKQHDSIWYFQAALVSLGIGAALYFLLTLFELALVLCC